MPAPLKYGEKPQTPAERQRRSRATRRAASPNANSRRVGIAPEPTSLRSDPDRWRSYRTQWERDRRKRAAPRIAVLDFETDPFNDETREAVYPFCGEIFDGENSTVIWEEKYEVFIDKIHAALLALDDTSRWVVYAHNGGKFDFMYLLRKLRGFVSFKGRALMSAKIGHVELRDSMHILPAPLANYKKEKFDYRNNAKGIRSKPEIKAKILQYLHSDCVYLYDLVKHFGDRHGLKLSIGQAAFGLLKARYKIDSLGSASDEYLRQWFFGGRVECPCGPGIWEGDIVMDDVNSMYPAVMAELEHPICADYSVRSLKYGSKINPNPHTVFLEVECDNFGALCQRGEDGLDFNVAHGIFKTTIWEYKTALELNLIRNVKIRACIDFPRRSNFADVVVPLYEERRAMKDRIDTMEAGPERDEVSREDLVTKFLLNNMWGKTAQNPRRFKEFFFSDFDACPPGECVAPFAYRDEDDGIWTMEASSENDYIVWKKPVSTHRFNNVATGASITGAARARTLRKMHEVGKPLYADTDCVIYFRNGPNTTSNALGTWKTEVEISRLLVAGKKLYGYQGSKEKVKCKGAPGLQWAELEKVIAGQTVTKINRAPTIAKSGHQSYSERDISITCPIDYRSRLFQR